MDSYPLLSSKTLDKRKTLSFLKNLNLKRKMGKRKGRIKRDKAHIKGINWTRELMQHVILVFFFFFFFFLC